MMNAGAKFILWITCYFLPLSSMFGAAKPQIIIGSKDFPESMLLTEIMATMIEQNSDFTVIRKQGLGGTFIVFEAIRQGQIDIYPEYTGTGLTAILKEGTNDLSARETLKLVREQFQDKYHLVWLDPFGFNNSYALAVSRSLKISSISQLNSIAGQIKAGFSHEFLSREDGYKGLKNYYGLQLPDIRGMEHGLVFKAIEDGQINLTDAYSTDGKLLRYHLKLLKDDRDFFPAYFAAPLVRDDLLKAYPEIRTILGKLNNSIDDETMQRLNYQVEVEGKTFCDVARNFLIKKNLIHSRGPADLKTQLIPWLKIKEHLVLTLVATLLAALLGIPLGLFISRFRKVASGVLSFANVIQTIPSLAILGFLIPIFGIGVKPAIIALFLYALLPIVRNTYVGIQTVNPALKEAGIALGMTSWQRLFLVELPLSSRLIMAGVRTAFVINIGTATLAAFIGAGGLGELILTGITLNNNQLIMKGAIPAAVLALALDFLLGKLENLLEPKGLKIQQ